MAKKLTKKQEKIKQDVVFADKIFDSAEDQLEQTIMELVFNQPFYANLIMNMTRKFTTEIPTAGVNVTDTVNLYVNPYFFMHLTLLERVDLLLHESHHVINNHFARLRDLEPKIFAPEDVTGTEEEKLIKRFTKSFEDQTKASLWNQAADLAINEFLPNLPRKVNMFNPKGEIMIVPATIKDEHGNEIPNPDPNVGKPMEAPLCFVKEFQKQYPAMTYEQTMEYYYEFLKQQHENDKKNGKGTKIQFVTVDDHSLWHKGDASEEEITQTVKDIVNKAVEQTNENDIGKLPADVKAAIESLNHVSRDWRSEIQRFASRAAEIKIEATRKKRNRRYGILFAGQKVEPKLHLGILIDSSGSVEDECLSQFHSEIKRLHNLDVVLTIITCDAKVHDVYKFNPKKKFICQGRGGTAFKPAFEEATKHDLDAILYFTDGECFNEEIPMPKIPVLWCLTPPFYTKSLPLWYANGTKHAQVIKIETKKKVSR